MKKLLTLFTLLLTVCSGAWGDENVKISPCSSSVKDSYASSYWFVPDGTVITAIVGSGAKSGSGYNSGKPKIQLDGKNNPDATITFTIAEGVTVTSFKVNKDGDLPNNVTYALDGTAVTIGTALTGLSKTGSMTFALHCSDASNSSTNRNTTITSFDITYTTSGGDVTAPTFSLTTPATTTNVAVTSHDVVLTASENVTKVGENITGTLKVGDAAATAINYTFNEAAKTLTYTFAEDLEYVTTYAFTVDANQVQDAAENKNAKTSAFSFTTKKAPTTLKTISEAKTWDFNSKVSGSKQFTGDDVNTEFVYADIDGLTFTSPFDEEALAFKGEYPFRGNDNKYAQNGTLHFKTSVPGTIKVNFSDTGTKASSSAVKRYLVVNDITTEYWTSREKSGDGAYAANLNVVTDEIPVPVGDVTIKGTSAIIVSKIVFTPTADAITVTTAGLATYASNYNLDFSEVTGIKAYRASISDKTITFNKVDKVPTGEGMLIRAMSNLDETTTFYVPHTESASPIENAMKRGEGTAVAYQPNPEIDIYNYVLSGGDNGVGFYQANGETVPTYRAYLQSTAALAKGFVINYDDEEGEETDGIKAVSTTVENGVRYNLAGQKVGADYKGIVIVNGKKVIIK